MIAIHDQFSRKLRNGLKTTCMGLGLVRLLQDARRFEEAKTTLCLLEDGFRSSALTACNRNAPPVRASARRGSSIRRGPVMRRDVQEVATPERSLSELRMSCFDQLAVSRPKNGHLPEPSPGTKTS
jgi:hypothetical protein